MSVIPGHVLPDALAVSSQLMWTHNHPHEHLTSLAAIWGQLVAHDISYTLPLSGYERCCDSMFRKENAMECYPIVANGKNKVIYISQIPRRPVGSTDQAYPSCFYVRIS